MLRVTAESAPPAAAGYRFPAEWEPHEATWLVWPRNTETWPRDIDDVRRTARRMIATLGRGGGYILAPSHVLQTDVPTANILALYETERTHP